ncbi:DHA2 family efflux MFS transporter permease subunit (plasmid) [Clostridium estertheticum]|uniref:DHA2 family efflux MFS transporter permease subunit n=1 Tax=Clostridium estertheticum TaxID=238834 RepID=UPI001C0B61DA|nr:DHA2 family efflux MFS transporter permease subunit [Clostridium estertheticum]MBU3217412.1 DHA2 family efflux MFS transporter permease subunit [Clostridium estertheticum]WAG58187.1 DHA2 family efflux MFS transporter permease subunit [Clostridium estertheticum]
MELESSKKRNLIIAVIMIGAFISSLSMSLLSAALPSIMRDFKVTANIGQWLTTIYMMVMGIMSATTAFLINRFSTRKLFMFSMSIFLIGCIISMFANNFIYLVISRMLQAVGAGVMMPLLQVVVLKLFPIEGRGRAMGVVGLVVGFSPTIGPTLSGLLVDSFGWRSLFYILTFISILVIISAYFLLENIGTTMKSNLDILSLILYALGFCGIMLGVTNEGSYGWISVSTYLPFVIGVICLLVFTLRQFKIKTPLLELRVFKNHNFTVSIILILLTYMALISAIVIIPIYVQSMRGYSAFYSGLLMLPGSLLLAVLNPLTGHLLDKYGARSVFITGMIFLLVGTLALSFLSSNTPLIYLSIMYCFRMIGLAFLVMPLTTWGLSSLDEKYISHGTAIINTLRQMVAAAGTAMLVTVMVTAAKNNKNTSQVLASIHGVNISFEVSSVLIIIGLIISILYFKKGRN